MRNKEKKNHADKMIHGLVYDHTKNLMFDLCDEYGVDISDLGFAQIERLNDRIGKAVKQIMVDAIINSPQSCVEEV